MRAYSVRSRLRRWRAASAAADHESGPGVRRIRVPRDRGSRGVTVSPATSNSSAPPADDLSRDLDQRERRERIRSAVLVLLIVVVVANFFWLATDTPTGSALSGYQASGHYFVSNH